MWKNVIINFLVLSFIVFSGEYLHYRVGLQNALKKNALDEIGSVRFDISGAFYSTSHQIVISGVPQFLKVRTFHICGIEMTDTGTTFTIPPTHKETPNNLMTTSSS